MCRHFSKLLYTRPVVAYGRGKKEEVVPKEEKKEARQLRAGCPTVVDPVSACQRSIAFWFGGTLYKEEILRKKNILLLVLWVWKPLNLKLWQLWRARCQGSEALMKASTGTSANYPRQDPLRTKAPLWRIHWEVSEQFELSVRSNFAEDQTHYEIWAKYHILSQSSNHKVYGP